MSEAPLMLGVSGLRGIVGKSLTPEVAARFAGAFGSWLVEQQSASERRHDRPIVTVGRDGRAGGRAIQLAAVSGLMAAGCDVADIGIAMTPTVAVLTDFHGWQRRAPAAGMVVTASHNPQEWNGLKLLVRDSDAKTGKPSAAAPAKDLAETIVQRFRAADASGPDWSAIGTVEEASEQGVHSAAVWAALSRLGIHKPTPRLRSSVVVLDAVGGSGSLITPGFLKSQFGGRVLIEGAHTNGIFTHTPEPTRENLPGLSRAVRRQRAAVGFAQDPDADRLAIVDERGQYIGEEYTLVLAAEALLSAGPKPRKSAGTKGKRRESVFVTNLSTSRMIDDVAARHGARVVRTAVGEANVVEAMKREKAAGNRVVLGGEGNGGVIWPEVTYVRDSLSAMALVLSLMARTGKKVSELVAEMPAYAIEKRKVEIPRREHARPAVEKLAAEYASQKIDLQDGVRVDWTEKRAWLHVRASNTEPIMRLIAEAPTAAEAQAILDEAADVIGG